LLAVTGLVNVLDLDAGAHVDATTTGTVGLDDAGTAVDDAGRGEIGARNVLHQLVNGQLGVVDQCQAAVDHLAEVVRRNIGGHTHSNAAGTVDQQVGNLGRQDVRNLQRTVVVGHPVDGFLVQIGQQFMGQTRATHLGVSHGRCGVAVHRTKVT